MEIEYIYELDDYLVINRTQRLKRKFRKLRNCIVFALAAACLVGGLQIVYCTIALGVSLDWIGVFGLSAFFLVIIFVFFVDNWISRFVASRQNLLGNLAKIEFSSEFIELKMNHVSSKFEWLAIVGIDEVSSHFLLWINKSQAIVIPKRAFKNDEEIENCREYLTNNYNGEVISLV